MSVESRGIFASKRFKGFAESEGPVSGRYEAPKPGVTIAAGGFQLFTRCIVVSIRCMPVIVVLVLSPLMGDGAESDRLYASCSVML
jgi:hypothetical protein